MKHKYSFAIAAALVLFFHNGLFAQSNSPTQIKLKSGTLEVNRQLPSINHAVLEANIGKYVIVTFAKLPSDDVKIEMAENGLQLLQYLPYNSFYVSVKQASTENRLSDWSILSISEIKQEMKIHPMISEKYPEWCYDGSGRVTLNVNYFGSLDDDYWTKFLAGLKGEVLENHVTSNRVFVALPEKNVQKIYTNSNVYFVEPVDAPSHPENYTGRTLHRSNMLAQDYYGGTKYDGTDVHVGMHDDGIIGPHIDYQGRLPIQFPTGNSGNHGDHVAGTIMGAGNLDPKVRGMAFGADLYVYGSSNNNYDSAVSHYNRYEIVITSKSYSNGCNAGYTSLTRELDQMTRQLPSLIHVFSAGNDGGSDCGYGAGAGWGNITGGHKMGKNVIATGNLSSTDVLAGSSSRGPADDGRIKPDICAKGSSVYSTVDVNTYESKSGTSMACPGISGAMAQLYQGYKETHGGSNPKSALMKGTIMNTADDLGNPGPDFKFGWGRINQRRAFDVLKNNQFIQANISAAAKDTHNIVVPNNVKELRIMVYWHDFEASTSAAMALVNDIDMVVLNPSNTSFSPWVLDPTPTVTALNSNAVRGTDHLNNVEQVTITNPVSGTYKVAVNGFAIPQGPQEYFVIYEFVYDEIVLTYPNGGEGLAPGETELIRWDASENASNFKLDYSTNGGTSWNVITTFIANDQRHYSWVVPNVASSNVLVRLGRNSDTDISDAPLTIIGVPTNLHAEWVCPDSIKVTWNPVASATSYTTYMLGNKYMDSISTTNANSYVFSGVNTSVQQWVAVSSNIGTGHTGRRTIAYQTPVASINCPLKDDAAIGLIHSPGTGTQFSCNPIEVAAYVRNDGSNNIMNIPIKCFIDNAPVLLGTHFDTIAPGDSSLFTYPTTVTPTSGNHTYRFEVDYSGDLNPTNDVSADVDVSYESGSAVSIPFTEDFESFTNCGTANNCGGTICNLVNGWVNDPSGFVDDHDWRVDSDGTPSGETGPSVDHNPGTSSGKYLFTEASENCNFMTAHLTTPCLDFTNIVKPRMSYWYHMYGVEMGDLIIDVNKAGRWYEEVKVPLSGDFGDMWLRDSVVLTAFAGSVVNIRFRGITGSFYRSDMAIDDIAVYESFIPPDAVEEFSHQFNINLYPNPVKDIVVLNWTKLEGTELTLQIADVTGKMIRTLNLAMGSNSNGRTEIDVTDLEGGIYFFSISDSHTKRVFKVVRM